MLHKVPPFLPRLKPTRHLSTIFEATDESFEEDSSKEWSECRRPEIRHKRQNHTQRAHSCEDIKVVPRDCLTFPPLGSKPTNSGKENRTHKQRSSPLESRNHGDRGNFGGIFPDFRPCNNSFVENAVHSTGETKSAGELKGKFRLKKQRTIDERNTVDSWLQFFGWAIYFWRGDGKFYTKVRRVNPSWPPCMWPRTSRLELFSDGADGM